MIGSRRDRACGWRRASSAFDSTHQLQRPGLLLSNGIVYIAFGSYGDWEPYHGWIFGHNAQTLQQVSFFNTTPTGGEGAIWQSGQGLSADDRGYIYTVTANGTLDVELGGSNYGDSILKFSPPAAVAGALTVADWFTPFNQESWLNQRYGPGINWRSPDSGDQSAPRPPARRGNSSWSIVTPWGTTMAQTVLIGSCKGSSRCGSSIFGSPVYWNSPSGPRVYVWGSDDRLKEYSFDGSLFQTTPVAVGSTFLGNIQPGGILSVSANGSTPGSGILWASHPTTNANLQTVPGMLRAYDASNVGVELWNSEQDPSRDSRRQLCEVLSAHDRRRQSISGDLLKRTTGLWPFCTRNHHSTHRRARSSAGRRPL